MHADLDTRYDRAAPVWGDKMRALGYHDAYLGLLAAHGAPAGAVIDAGCGSGAFAAAWLATVGVPERLTLLDPSEKMLARAAAATRAARPEIHRGLLSDRPGPADAVLAAHVIEHCPDPAAALGDLRAMLRAGGRLYLVASKPHWCNAIIWLQWRHRTFGAAQMEGLLGAAGFEVAGTHAFPVGPPSRTSRAWIARAV